MNSREEPDPGVAPGRSAVRIPWFKGDHFTIHCDLAAGDIDAQVCQTQGLPVFACLRRFGFADHFTDLRPAQHGFDAGSIPHTEGLAI